MEPLEIFDSINNKHINVYVTSEVAEKCRSDNAFAQDLFNKLQDQNIEDGSAIEVETIKCEVEESSIIEENVGIYKFVDKETWGRRETLKLLKAYQRNKDKFKEYTQRKIVWSIIANELAQHGVYKSADKCAEKWKNLIRTYKAIGEKPCTPTRFQYLEEMRNIFNDTKVVLSDTDSEDDKTESQFISDLSQVDVPIEESTEKESWSKYETLKLLKCFQKYKGLKQDFSTEKQFWARISVQLAKDKIYKLPEKCATKWKNLYRSYKRNIEKPSLPLRFQYFQEVSDVINNVEIQVPDHIVNASEDTDFEKILDPEEFKCFVEKTDFYVKPKDVTSWLPEETMKLINAYKKHKDRFKMCPSKKYVWAIIASELLKDGIQRDVEKCENKWKSLLRAYRRGLESGEFPRFNFHDEIAECLGHEVNGDEVSTTQNDTSMTHEPMEDEMDDENSVDNAEAPGNEGKVASNDADNAAYEEIIIQTEADQATDGDSKVWSFNEVTALIKAYANHKNDFKDVKRKPKMWSEISLELASNNMQRTPQNCEKKWRALYNVYRTHKTNKSGPGRFVFYSQIDDVFKGNQEENSEEIEEVGVHNEKCKCMKKRMLERQQRHIERMQLLKRKLDLEERKVEAFEYYVKQLKVTNDNR